MAKGDGGGFAALGATERERTRGMAENAVLWWPLLVGWLTFSQPEVSIFSGMLQPDESKLFQTSDCCSLWLGPLPVLAPPSPHRGSVGLFV